MKRRNLFQRSRLRTLIAGAAISLQFAAIDDFAVARAAQTAIEPLPMLRDKAAVVNGDSVAETCADGAVNGLITVSIAAATALMTEIALPSYPLLVGTGLAVGCSMRIVGERLKGYGLWLWWGEP